MRPTAHRLTIAVALCLVGMPVAHATGAVFKPTRFDDPPPGNCRPSDCSLREALIAANDQFSRDTVLLDRGTYELEIPAVPADLGEDNGDLDIYNPITIRGKGAPRTRIDANGLDRVIYYNDQNLDLVGTRIESLTLTGGDATAVVASGHPPWGGALQITNPASKVLLKRTVIRGNDAQFGGGVHSQGAVLTVKQSTIMGNAAAEGGGLRVPVRIFSEPLTRILSSTISRNTAQKGGGILADGAGSSATLFVPRLEVLNSTVANNRTTAEGGGIMADNGAVVALDHATVAFNEADDDDAGGGVGGGIHQHSGASFAFRDSLLAENTVGVSGSGPACDGTFEGVGSLVDNTGTNPACSWSGTPPLFNPMPRVDRLAKNGGPTKTAKLRANSPAVGLSDECPGRDQRGVARPSSDCDAGAYERQAP